MRAGAPFGRALQEAVADDLRAAGVTPTPELLAFLAARAAGRLRALHVGLFVLAGLVWAIASGLVLQALDPAMSRVPAFLVVGTLVAFPVHLVLDFARRRLTVALARRLGCSEGHGDEGRTGS